MTADKASPFLFTQCQSIHARSLFPCQDTPRVKCTYSATVHAPNDLTVLMSALRTDASKSSDIEPTLRIHCFEQNIPIPSYLVALACGGLISRKIGSRSHVWAEPSVVDRAAYEFGEIDQFLEAAESICGPYEWGLYDILVLPPSFPFGGMENPCLTCVTPTLLAGDRSQVNVVAHEIAHSWTGNLVTNASWEHFWLNEGHTVYLERLILEKVYGSQMRELDLELGFETLQETLAEYGAGHPFTKLVPNLENVHPDEAFSSIPYEKGSLLLYYLEVTYGKSKLLTWLRAYLQRYRLTSLCTQTWLDFLFQQIGLELRDAVPWNDWLYKTDQPPWKPTFTHELSGPCRNLVHTIITTALDKHADSGAAVRSAFDNFNPTQKELALKLLCDKTPVSAENLGVMDSMLDLSSIGNCEIRFRWSLVCVKSHYQPALDSCFTFLNSQGRMKYTRPLYRELGRWPDVRERTIANFYANRPFMHGTTAAMVAQDLGLSDSTECISK